MAMLAQANLTFACVCPSTAAHQVHAISFMMVTQEGTGSPIDRFRAGVSHFAGFGVMPGVSGLRHVPAKLQLDSLSTPQSESPSQLTPDSPSPIGRKQV